MRRIGPPEAIDQERRGFLGGAMVALAAAQLGAVGAAQARSERAGGAGIQIADAGTAPSLGALKQIDAGLLNVGYAEVGPADGLPVILLHGWPYDIHTYADVGPLLASAGCRVIVPYLRGFGTTRFLATRSAMASSRSSPSTPSP